MYPLLGSTPIGPGVVAIPVALVTTVVILSAPTILVFASGNHRSKKFNTGREEAQLFVGIWVLHGVSKRNVTEDCSSSTLV